MTKLQDFLPRITGNRAEYLGGITTRSAIGEQAGEIMAHRRL